MNARRLPQSHAARGGQPRTSGTRLSVASAILVLLALTVPTAASAQQDPSEDLFWPWQLLEYRADPRDDELTPVPAGIGITAGLFADTLTIEGTCSTARTGRVEPAVVHRWRSVANASRWSGGSPWTSRSPT